MVKYHYDLWVFVLMPYLRAFSISISFSFQLISTQMRSSLVADDGEVTVTTVRDTILIIRISGCAGLRETPDL